MKDVTHTRVARSSPIQVLLVDDHAPIRELTRIFAERDGRFAVVAEAADGAAAVELARDRRPHAAILDINMPVMSGLQAIPLLRECAPAMAIVVFSTNARPRDLLELGVDAWHLKSDPLREVLESVARSARPPPPRG